ncbi:MAG: serine/threonine-protein kinase [Polyangiaceae bacterium]
MQGHVLGGRYRLETPIGEGTMGSVWRAEHLTLGVPVAVKLVQAHSAQLPEALARFEREARLAARVRSAHVAHVLDYGVDRGHPYLAMEWLEGESVRARLTRQKRLSLVEVVELSTHVGRALGAAHKLNLVHRDIKPDNVFIVDGEFGGPETYKVLDFGVAKSADQLGLDSTAFMTKPGALVGTPYYMSPEQALGEPVDFRADLWALTVTIFECLVGERPFQDSTLRGLIGKVVSGSIPIPSQRVAGLPPAFDAFVAKGLSRDPASRFASAMELAREMAKVVFGG